MKKFIKKIRPSVFTLVFGLLGGIVLGEVLGSKTAGDNLIFATLLVVVLLGESVVIIVYDYAHA